MTIEEFAAECLELGFYPTIEVFSDDGGFLIMLDSADFKGQITKYCKTFEEWSDTAKAALAAARKSKK